METQTKERWFVARAGSVERGPNYAWRDGYARVLPDGGIQYPWLTKQEFQRHARRNNASITFFASIEDAKQALREDNKP